MNAMPETGVRKSKSITLQLFLLIFGIFLTTILGVTLTVYNSLGNDLTRSIQSNLANSALELTERFDTKFADKALDLNTWANMEVMDDLVTGDVDGRIGRTLALLKSRYKLSGNIYVFDTEGAIIASSGSTEALKQHRISPPITWLTKKNESMFIDKHVDPFNKGTVVAFSHAIKASFADITLGSVVLTYPWAEVENTLSANNNNLLVLTGENNIILYADKTFSAESGDALTKAILGGARALTLNGVVYLVGVGKPRPDQLRYPVGWRITALSPESVAYEPIRALGLQIGKLTLMLGLPLALLILFMTRQWVRPIKQLTETVADITNSMDLSKRVPVSSSDEVGLLAKVFNALTEKLQQTLGENREFARKLEDINRNLELTVAQRTEQYHVANQELSKTVQELETAQSQLVRSEKMTRARNGVLELLAKGAPLREILDGVLRSVEIEDPSMLCSILLLDDEGKHLVTSAAHNLPDSYNAAIDGMAIGVGCGSCGNAAFTGVRSIVEDMQTHPNCADFKELSAQCGLRACWSEPIQAISGKVFGTFVIYHHEARAPNEKDIELMVNTANLAGIAIEHKDSEAELQMAALVYQISSEAMTITDANGAIISINPAFTQLTGYLPEEVIGKNPSILKSGRQDQAFYQDMWRSLNATGHWQGEIWNRRKDGAVYAEWLTINVTRNADGSIHRHVALFSDITEKKKSDELIWRQANFDPLTQLPNRRLFRDRLEQEIKKAHRAGLSLALLFIDLDRFKEVNDTLGHDVGDLLLLQAAGRLRDCVRDTDTVARLGGDEFTVILAELADTSQVDRVAQSITQKLNESFQLGNETVYVSGSVGITLYPADASDAEDLLKNADQAMYVSKNAGRNRFSYFTNALQEKALTRQQLVKDLHGALAANQFRVYFQPIVDLATGRITKAEALLRWQHPSRGIIGPAEFIPVAEETGLINSIGEWVFMESARQVKHWAELYGSGFQVSVNKSPVQFQAVADHGTWIDHLAQLGLSGQNIVIEITEGLLLNADSDISRQLLQFRDAGIQVAIDDFGTGYSALSYLKKFDIDYLKIDQSFVRSLAADVNDMALSEAIIVMAHKLGLKVIAEGIETEEQRKLLASAGCDYGQGYLFSRPIPPEEFEVLLKNGCQPTSNSLFQ